MSSPPHRGSESGRQQQWPAQAGLLDEAAGDLEGLKGLAGGEPELEPGSHAVLQAEVGELGGPLC